MTAHHIFCASFILTLISIGCFYAVFNPKPNMSAFKRAGSRDKAQKILDAWGNKGHAKANRNLAFDWVFILIYSTMWVSGAMYLGPLVDAKLRVPAMLFTGIGLAGALCDIIENVCLWIMLHGNDSETAPRICKRVRPINVGLFFTAAVYFLIAATVWANDPRHWEDVVLLDETITLPEDGYKVWPRDHGETGLLKTEYHLISGPSIDVRFFDEENANVYESMLKDPALCGTVVYDPGLSFSPLARSYTSDWIEVTQGHYYLVAENGDCGKAKPPWDGIDNPAKVRVRIVGKKRPKSNWERWFG